MKYIEIEATQELLDNLARATYDLLRDEGAVFHNHTNTTFLVKDIGLWQAIISHPCFAWHSQICSAVAYCHYVPNTGGSASSMINIPWNRRAFKGNNFVFYVGEQR